MAEHRTSFVADDALKANLDALARKLDRSRSAIIAEALRRYMAEQGLQPDRTPKLRLEIIYETGS